MFLLRESTDETTTTTDFNNDEKYTAMLQTRHNYKQAILSAVFFYLFLLQLKPTLNSKDIKFPNAQIKNKIHDCNVSVSVQNETQALKDPVRDVFLGSQVGFED